ncbi:MAG: CIS tube protein [Gammaproteobacteria bacterium]
MIETPIGSAKQGPGKAVLEIVRPQGQAPVPLLFNPTEYQLQKSNNFAEIAIPGLETPPLQYVRGSAQKLTTELLVDTSDTLEDVRERYTNALRKLMNIHGDIHAPPIVRLVWDGEVFLGVVESLNITYVLFTPDGVPLRAKLNLVLMEYRTVEDQVAETPRASPDVDKSHTVRRGDTLTSIATLAYNDPTVWREIASRNGIEDPRQLTPGHVLQLPRLR